MAEFLYPGSDTFPGLDVYPGVYDGPIDPPTERSDFACIVGPTRLRTPVTVGPTRVAATPGPTRTAPTPGPTRQAPTPGPTRIQRGA